MDGCLLGETIGRRPGPPGPTPPGHPAVRCLAQTRPWYVWVLGPASEIRQLNLFPNCSLTFSAEMIKNHISSACHRDDQNFYFFRLSPPRRKAAATVLMSRSSIWKPLVDARCVWICMVFPSFAPPADHPRHL